MDTAIQIQKQWEASDEWDQRSAREAQIKRAEVESNEAAIDRRIRRNIEQYGPWSHSIPGAGIPKPPMVSETRINNNGVVRGTLFLPLCSF